MAQTKQTASVFLIFGNDEFSVSSRAKELIDRLVPPASRALGLEIIDGRVDNGDEAVAALRRCMEGLQTVGLLLGEKVVWLRDANFLGPDLGKAAAIKARTGDLADMIKAGLAPGQKLVITADKVDGRSAFYNACKERAEITTLEVTEKPHEIDREAGGLTDEALRKAGLRMSSDARGLFLERVGNDTRHIASEVEKLDLYLNDRRDVAVGDVRAIVSSSRETAAWDFADAVGQRDIAWALKVLGQLVSQKESIMRLVAGLERRFAQLIVLRTAIDRRWARVQYKGSWGSVAWDAPPEAERLLGSLDKDDPRKINPYRVVKLAAQAECYSLSELVAAREQVVRARSRMVSTAVSQTLILELLLMKLIGAGQRPSAR